MNFSSFAISWSQLTPESWDDCLFWEIIVNDIVIINNITIHHHKHHIFIICHTIHLKTNINQGLYCMIIIISWSIHMPSSLSNHGQYCHFLQSSQTWVSSVLANTLASYRQQCFNSIFRHSLGAVEELKNSKYAGNDTSEIYFLF